MHQVEAYLDMLRRMGMHHLQHRGLELYSTKGRHAADRRWQQAGLDAHPRVSAQYRGQLADQTLDRGRIYRLANCCATRDVSRLFRRRR